MEKKNKAQHLLNIDTHCIENPCVRFPKIRGHTFTTSNLFIFKPWSLTGFRSFLKGASQVSNPEIGISHGTIVTSYITLHQLACVYRHSRWQMCIQCFTAFLSFSVNWCPSYITKQPCVLYGASLSCFRSPRFLSHLVSSHLIPSFYLSARFPLQIMKVK